MAREEGIDHITNLVDMNLSKLWEIVKDRGAGMLQSMRLQRIGHDLMTEQQHISDITHNLFLTYFTYLA